MHTVRSIINHRPLTAFAIMAYILSWLVVIPTGGLLLPWGPALAALAVVGLGAGRSGVAAWWRGVTRRTSWRWYVLAAVLPIGMTFAAAGLNLLLGGRIAHAIDWITPLQVLPIMLLVSGMWEEPGWTGYALPSLFERYNATRYGVLVASTIMALIRVGWHLPLMLAGHIYWSDIALIIAAQLVFAWLFNRSGSVLPIMLLHVINNTISGEFVQQWFVGADWVRQSWLLAILWSVLALAVLLVAGKNLGRDLAVPKPQPSEALQIAYTEQV